MLDHLEKAMLRVAYNHIDRSSVKRVAGSTIWANVRLIYPDLAPVVVPARLRRLVSLGLLEKDSPASGCRYKLYGRTEAGRHQLGA
jgi:hypothetical protein